MLYGRRDECAAIDALLREARAGRSGVVVIRGDAGIGKTALLEHAEAAAAGMRLLHASGVESESELPYAALHQLLRPVRAAIDDEALRAALGMADGRPDRFAVSVALLNLLAELADQQPVACLVDDAQWLDHASADALLFAARRMEAEPIAVVMTARDGSAAPFEAPGVAELRLDGLDVTASAELLDSRADGSLTPLARRRLIAATAGNPLALIELPVALTDDQRSGRRGLDGPLPLSDVLERSFLDRLRALPEGSRRLLLLAAADDSGDEDVVLRAARLGGLEEGSVEGAESVGLLRFRDHRVEFRHPLVRSAVYGRAGAEQRHAAHALLAGALGGEADADRRAWHRALATLGPDEEVAAELESTAERAQSRSGHAAAARALARAAELSSELGPRARRLVLAGESAWLAGRPDEALELLAQAERLDLEPWLTSKVQRLRGVIQLRQGNPTVAHDLLRAAAPQNDDPLWTLMLAAEAASYAGRMDWMIEIGAEALELPAERTADRFVRLMLGGIAAVFSGDMEVGTARLQESLEAARGLTDPHELVAAGTAAAHCGDTAESLRLYSEAETAARRSGALAQIPFALEVKSVALYAADRYAETVEASTEGLALARETGLVASAANHLAALAMAAAKQGREQDCLRFADEALDLALPRGIALPAVTARWAIGTLHLGMGRPEEALRALDDAIKVPGVFHELVQRRSAPDRFDAALRIGRRDVCEEAARHYELWRAAPWAEAILLRFEALLAEGDAAVGLFERALELHRSAPRPFEDARTALDYGEFLRRERRRTDARVQLRAAVEAFERLGAVPWAERARGELRATGETARKRDPSTIDDLTPQELQIAKLVAHDGMSNPQIAARLFLSRRTVEYHLRKVYSKLGIASRTELATVELT